MRNTLCNVQQTFQAAGLVLQDGTNTHTTMS